MLSENRNFTTKHQKKVLILVLVEYALGVVSVLLNAVCFFVLILVLVEYALGVYSEYFVQKMMLVLILVLVEYALGDAELADLSSKLRS